MHLMEKQWSHIMFSPPHSLRLPSGERRMDSKNKASCSGCALKQPIYWYWGLTGVASYESLFLLRVPGLVAVNKVLSYAQGVSVYVLVPWRYNPTMASQSTQLSQPAMPSNSQQSGLWTRPELEGLVAWMEDNQEELQRKQITWHKMVKD